MIPIEVIASPRHEVSPVGNVPGAMFLAELPVELVVHFSDSL